METPDSIVEILDIIEEDRENSIKEIQNILSILLSTGKNIEGSNLTDERSYKLLPESLLCLTEFKDNLHRIAAPFLANDLELIYNVIYGATMVGFELSAVTSSKMNKGRKLRQAKADKNKPITQRYLDILREYIGEQKVSKHTKYIVSDMEFLNEKCKAQGLKTVSRNTWIKLMKALGYGKRGSRSE